MIRPPEPLCMDLTGSGRSKILPKFSAINEGKYRLKVRLGELVAAATGTDFCHTDESGYESTINVLPDNVFLEIFDSCRKDHDPDEPPFLPVWRWHGLVHVCQRWRQIIFGSPRRLDLQILCTNGTPVENLNFWPPFPITIHYPYHETFTPYDEDSLLVTLEHSGRIRQIDLSLTGPQLREVATVMMHEPFPALKRLILGWKDTRPPPLSRGFLGGSAPCLQYIHLDGIPFPALPTLLSSTNDLLDLILDDIPQDGYISPQAMHACLAALPRLKSLSIAFKWTTTRRDRILNPPPATWTRTLLPALTSFEFQGASTYLEELVSRIDSPQLNHIDISYLHQHFQVEFQVAQLFEFIDRSEDPEITLIRHAEINISDLWVTFDMYPCPDSYPDWDRVSALIYCERIDLQVLRTAQVFSQPSATLSRVVHLKLSRCPANAVYADSHRNGWLNLLCQFPTVRTLHVSQEFAEHVVRALEDATGAMVIEVLPVLDLIYLDSQPVSSVENFLAARRLSGRPVAIVDTEVEFDERVKSYVNK